MPPEILSYNGGINPDTSLGTLPQNQLVSAKNVILTGASLINRGGPFKLVVVNGTGGASKYVSSLFYWNDQVNEKEWFIMGARDTSNNPQIYQMVNDGTTTTATVITSGSANEWAQYDVLNGILCIAASALPLQWTGVGSVSALGASWTTLNVSMLAVKTVNNILFFAGNLSSYIYWSSVGDPTTYNSGNFIPFRLSDGDTIQALSYIGTDLIIFKRFSIGALSTQTQILSGVVTLGPLTTLNVGIGCASPNAVDRLPDGRLVFLGGNGHLYLFDGNVPIDVSQQAYPGSSVQSLITAAAQFFVYGTGGAIVKVVPMRHEVWVILQDPGANANDYWIYDYLNNIWIEKPSTTNTYQIISACVGSSGKFTNPSGFKTVAGTLSGTYDQMNVLITGDAGGTVWIEDCGINTDQSGSDPITQIEFSIPVQSDQRSNVRNFFVLPLKTGSASQTITYYVGQNGTYGSSQTFTTTGNWDRLQIQLINADYMTSQQIKVTYPTASTVQFDPAYISQEADQ